MIRHEVFTRLRAGVAVVGLGAFVAILPPAKADPAEEFFHGRQLTLYIGGGTGGSVDLYARLLARHIVRHLPGDPVIVPRNLPAAGGVQAFMTLGSTAPRDGSAFATSARGPLTDPLYSDKPETYDVTKFIWLGALNDDTTICYTGKQSSIRTLADARQTETTMAATGVVGESAKFPAALNATLGTKFKVISGYSGTSNTLLAVERGETDGRCATVGSINATQPGALQQGRLNVLVQVGLEKSDGFDGVPLAIDEATSDEDRAFLKLLVKPLAISGAFALPAGVPADRARIWRKAFAATLKDPRFREEAASMRLDLTEHSGAEVEEIVRQIYATPKPVIERARQVFQTAN